MDTIENTNTMTLICRSCLSTNPNNMISLSIPSQDQLNLTYLECFNYCTNLSDWIYDDGGVDVDGHADYNDGNIVNKSPKLYMPNTICEDCLNELRLAFNFRTKCEKSDYELRRKLKKSIEYVNDDDNVDNSDIEHFIFDDENCNNEFIIEKDTEYLDEDEDEDVGEQQDEQHHELTNQPVNDDNNDDYYDSGGVDDQFNQNDEENRKEMYEKCKDQVIEVENVQINFHIIDNGQYEELIEKSGQNQKYQEQNNKYENINQEDVIFIIGQSTTNVKDVTSDVADKSWPLTNDKSTTTKNVDTKSNKFECDSCKRGFKTKSTLEKHMLRQHCQQKLDPNRKIRTLKKKQKTKPNDKNPNDQFKCEICNRNYCNKKYFLKHQLIHMGIKPENNHLCSECGKGFLTLQRLKIHSLTHTGEKNFSCNQCDKSFSTQYRLHSHQRIHTGERPYHCTICSMSFSQANALKCHKRVHTGEKPYRCKYCDKSFSQNTILKTHMTLHTGKTVKCPDCDKKFSRASYLILHRREHTGEKPYACDRCPNRYKQKGHLDRHMDTHLGVKHKCELCGNQYSKRWSLKMHMFSHSDTKPFNCEECDVSFLRRDKYKNHMQHNHSISIENKDLYQTKLNDDVIVKKIQI